MYDAVIELFKRHINTFTVQESYAAAEVRFLGFGVALHTEAGS